MKFTADKACKSLDYVLIGLWTDQYQIHQDIYTNTGSCRYRCSATNPHGETHQDYYVEVFENEEQFYGLGELSFIDEAIDDVTDDVTTGFDVVTGGTREPATTGPLTTETEGTEAVSADSTTPYYMKFF